MDTGTNESVRFERDCEVVVIPSWDEVSLPAGEPDQGGTAVRPAVESDDDVRAGAPGTRPLLNRD